MLSTRLVNWFLTWDTIYHNKKWGSGISFLQVKTSLKSKFFIRSTLLFLDGQHIKVQYWLKFNCGWFLSLSRKVEPSHSFLWCLVMAIMLDGWQHVKVCNWPKFKVVSFHYQQWMKKLHFRTLYICNRIIADGTVICFGNSPHMEG